MTKQHSSAAPKANSAAASTITWRPILWACIFVVLAYCTFFIPFLGLAAASLALIFSLKLKNAQGHVGHLVAAYFTIVLSIVAVVLALVWTVLYAVMWIIGGLL